MEKVRTPAQNKRLFGLLAKLHITDDQRAVLVYEFSKGRTESSAGLTTGECESLCNHLQEIVNRENDKLRRLRWCLYYSFRDSGYDCYRLPGNKPNLEAIEEYAVKYWGKKTTEMTAEEIEKKIRPIQNWKYAKKNKRSTGY